MEEEATLIVKVNGEMKTQIISDILYVVERNNRVFLIKNDGSDLIEQSVDEMEELIDSRKYFRINSRYLVKFSAIQAMYPHSFEKIRVRLKPESKEDVIVAKEKVAAFKQWLLE